MNELNIKSEYLINNEAELRSLCGETTESIWAKATTVITEPMQKFISLSPFCCLSSQNKEMKTDLSPRGDPAGFVKVFNESTLLMPDRPGNRRYDTMRNIVETPQVSILFIIPGVPITLRVNGRAQISHDPELIEQFEVKGKLPKLVVIIHVEEAYGHCAKAILRSKLWDPASQLEPSSAPSLGDLMAHHRKISTEDVSAINSSIKQDLIDSMY